MMATFAKTPLLNTLLDLKALTGRITRKKVTSPGSKVNSPQVLLSHIGE